VLAGEDEGLRSTYQLWPLYQTVPTTKGCHMIPTVGAAVVRVARDVSAGLQAEKMASKISVGQRSVESGRDQRLTLVPRIIVKHSALLELSR
jgi:hypothetical protein